MPYGVENEEAERDEAHVRDRRVGDQLLHVGLHQGHQADVHHRDQRQRDHQPGQLARRVGQDRQREPHESVGPQLQHDRRQHHRAAGRRLDVRIRQPGMHRPHRHLDREREQEAEEQQHLGGERQRQVVPVEDLEAAAGLAVQVQQRDQQQQRTGQGVEEELERRVDAVGAAPDADDDEHRDQGGLEEDVEQHPVERGEDAVHQPGKDQERGVVLRHAALHHRPARDHHQDGDEAVEQHEQHADAVHPEVVVDVEARDPGDVLDELHARVVQVESGVERDRHREADQRADQRQPALHRRVALAARRQHQQPGDDRNPDRERKQVGVHECLLLLFTCAGRNRSAARPRSAS